MNFDSHCLFLQAEDGIRDIGVTGVQTCALPILRPTSAATSSGSQPCEGLLPGSEVNRPPTREVARQLFPPPVVSQPKPPGTNMSDGPVQPVPDFFGSSMVRSVVVEGSPPPVWAVNSDQEKISGSLAVPASGAPQATVAVAVTCVDSWPMTGAN